MKEKKNIHQPDELMDKELIDVGVRFTDRTQEAEEVSEAEYEHEETVQITGTGKIGKVLANLSGLVAADSLLIFMCMQDKIELLYGLVFLAAASAFFGGKVNNARV